MIDSRRSYYDSDAEKIPRNERFRGGNCCCCCQTPNFFPGYYPGNYPYLPGQQPYNPTGPFNPPNGPPIGNNPNFTAGGFPFVPNNGQYPGISPNFPPPNGVPMPPNVPPAGTPLQPNPQNPIQPGSPRPNPNPRDRPKPKDVNKSIDSKEAEVQSDKNGGTRADHSIESIEVGRRNSRKSSRKFVYVS